MSRARDRIALERDGRVHTVLDLLPHGQAEVP
jgi:hypothetical protein